MATRSVVRYRTRTVRSRSRSRIGGSSRKIPLAVVAGLVPALQFAAEPAFDTGTRFNRLIAAFIGYSPGEHKWTSYYLPRGLYPLLGGVLLHSLANGFGVNRAIARWKLPVEI